MTQTERQLISMMDENKRRAIRSAYERARLLVFGHIVPNKRPLRIAMFRNVINAAAINGRL